MPVTKTSVALMECQGSYLALSKEDRKGDEFKDLIAGEIEQSDSSATSAILRELEEETGIQKSSEEIDRMRPYIFRINHVYYHIHPYYINMDENPGVDVSDEHTGYEWLDKENVDEFDAAKYFNIRYIEHARNGGTNLRKHQKGHALPIVNLSEVTHGYSSSVSDEEIDKILAELD